MNYNYIMSTPQEAIFTVKKYDSLKPTSYKPH